MAVRAIKASGLRSRSKTVVKARALSGTPKTAADGVVKRVDKAATPAATAGKAVKKAAALTARSTKTSGPRIRTQTAARSLDLASAPPKTAIDESAKVVKKGSNAAAATAEAVNKATAVAVRSIAGSGPGSRLEVAAKAVKLASIPPKTLVNQTVKLVAGASKQAVATSETVKGETVYAIDTYKDAATETFDNTEELVKAASEFVAGVAEIHQTIWTSMQRAIHAAVELPGQFASCTSFADVAEKQRAMMRQGFHEWLTIGQEILMANRRITDRAINAMELR